MVKNNLVLKTALLIALAIEFTACGKRGPLVYPDMVVPKAPVSVEAGTVGDGVRLRFVMPDVEESDNDPKSISEIRIYRQDVPILQSFCSDCNDSIPLYRTIYLDALRNAERHGRTILFFDTDISKDHKYRYRVALKTRDGVVGIQSVPSTVPVNNPFAAPFLSLESTPTEVILSFSGERPEEKIFTGYQIYRRSEGAQRSFIPLLTIPVKENSYTDFTLKSGVKYFYSVRSVYRNERGELSESLLSNEVGAERTRDN